jgi:amino-acid N-acetyltransferase
MPDLPPPPRVRRAVAHDADAIRRLVRSERLNPNDLDWRRFFVAVDGGGGLIGAVQMRRHADGSAELGSLVVAPAWRGRGLAAALIDSLLADHAGVPVWMITGSAVAVHFERWHFAPVAAREAPAAVRRNWRLGSAMGWLRLPLTGRRKLLAILARPAQAPTTATPRSPSASLTLLPTSHARPSAGMTTNSGPSSVSSVSSCTAPR